MKPQISADEALNQATEQTKDAPKTLIIDDLNTQIESKKKFVVDLDKQIDNKNSQLTEVSAKKQEVEKKIKELEVEFEKKTLEGAPKLNELIVLNKGILKEQKEAATELQVATGNNNGSVERLKSETAKFEQARAKFEQAKVNFEEAKRKMEIEELNIGNQRKELAEKEFDLNKKNLELSGQSAKSQKPKK